jgi:phosphodiesterase/alkaline phosphatase D-like protein
VLSGDLHNFLAGNLTTTGEQSGTPVGTEMLAGSATSFGLPEETGIPAATLDSLRKAADPHIVYADLVDRGYGVVTVKKHELLGEFKSTNTMQPHSNARTIGRFKVESGIPQLHEV